MSGVATLKAGAKRGFDEMSVDVPPGPGCSPGRIPLLTPLPKRARAVTSAPCSSSAATATPPAPPFACVGAPGGASPGAAPTPATNSQNRPFSPEEVAALATHVPKRLKRLAEKVATGHVTVADKIFSVMDVREIVESVVAERESRLKDEYTKILNDRLAQQFRDFTKFNEDHVARQYRDKDFAYLS